MVRIRPHPIVTVPINPYIGSTGPQSIQGTPLGLHTSSHSRVPAQHCGVHPVASVPPQPGMHW
jgi:hypothetical protein